MIDPKPRGATICSPELADVLEGEKPTPGDEGGERCGRHEDIYTVTVQSMLTVPLTDEHILAREAKLERWEVYNNKAYNVLCLLTKGVASSFLVRFAGGPARGNNPTGR